MRVLITGIQINTLKESIVTLECGFAFFFTVLTATEPPDTASTVDLCWGILCNINCQFALISGHYLLNTSTFSLSIISHLIIVLFSQLSLLIFFSVGNTVLIYFICR